MRKLGSTILVLSLLFVCSRDALSAGIEVNAIGARAVGMGGNVRSLAKGWSAMYWNPASLVHSPGGMSAGLSSSYLVPRSSFKTGNSHYFNVHGGELYRPFSATYLERRTDDAMNSLVPAAGIVYGKDRWAIGLGVWAPLGWSIKWDLLDTEVYNAAYPQFEYESDIRIIDIHPTFSYKINEKLSLGAGLSFLSGRVEIRQPAFLQNPYLYDQNLYRTLRSISGADTVILNAMRRPPFDHLINQAEMKSTGRGYGANIGLLYKPTEDWSIGLVGQFFADLRIKGDYSQVAYFADRGDYQRLVDDYDATVFSKLYNAGQLDDLQYSVISDFYSGQVQDRIRTRATTKIPLPLKFAAGVSFSGFTDLIIATNFEYTQWSVWDVFKIKDLNGEQVSQLNWHWNDVFKLGLGIEYVAPWATLRAGFSTESRAATDESVIPSIPDIGRRNVLDIGVGVPIGRTEISLAYERIMIADRTISDWQYDDITVAQNIAGAYGIDVYVLMLGFDYSF